MDTTVRTNRQRTDSMSETPDEFELAVEWLRYAKRIVAFTGVGISADSGIATFRDDAGIWEEFPPERFATWDGLLETLESKPDELAGFLLAVLEPIAQAEPNAAHKALAELERHRNVTVVTQNVDGLHRLAGNAVVKEIHGTLFEVVTLGGRFVRLIDREELKRIVRRLHAVRAEGSNTSDLLATIEPLIGMDANDAYRPKLVLFGDELNEPDWSDSLAAARDCDLVISVGTSGEVFPAAQLPLLAREAGARVLVIDPAVGTSANVWLQDKASEMLPRLVQRAFG